MNQVDAKALREAYKDVEQQAHSMRGRPEEYRVITGLCPVNVIEMQAQRIVELFNKLEALTAENAALKAENCIQDFIITAVKDLVRESEGVIGWHLNGDVASWDEVLPELSHSETPTTDAAIDEIGAKAIEGFVSDLAYTLRTAGGGDGYHSNPYPECADFIELKGGDYVESLRTGEHL